MQIKALSVLHQPAADQVEGLLAGPEADSVAVAVEVALDGLGLLGVADGDVDQAYGLLFRAAAGAGNACDAYADGGAGGEADSAG